MDDTGHQIPQKLIVRIGLRCRTTKRELELPSSIAIWSARSSKSSITGKEGLEAIGPPELPARPGVEALGVPGLLGVPAPLDGGT